MTLFGLFNLNKPAGLTSRDAVDRVERLVRPARAGHAGTLDPLATGVLVICVGQATRLIQFVQQMPKTYRATFQLGQTSETDDIESKQVFVVNAVEPSRDMLDNAIERFIGDIQQRPPTHSAIKLAGRRAYQLARRGIEVDLQPRAVTIHSIAVRRYAYPDLELEVVCGSGTYIRSLGRDLGEALGTGAVMSELVRTAIGRFAIEDAVSIDDLTADTFLHLQPALTAVADLPHVTLSASQRLEIRHGRPILTSWLGSDAVLSINAAGPAVKEIAGVDAAGQLIAILYEKQPGELWPVHAFNA